MKKFIGIIAGLKMGVSSIVMGASFEVVDGGGYLVGVDRLTQQEIRLVRSSDFEFDPVSGRFESEDVTLLSWNPNAPAMHAFNLDAMFKQLCLPTTEIEFIGNLSSGSATPIGGSFVKTQRIFDNLGRHHNLIFTFTRLPAGVDDDNRIQYSTDITVAGGTVKWMYGMGTVLSCSGVPMLITFNNRGQLNLVDYGQPTESNTSPKLYIEWTDTSIKSAPLELTLKLGKGKGANPTLWYGEPTPSAIANLTAYDGSSMISYSQQDGGSAFSRFYSSKEPLRFSWIEKETGLKSYLSKFSQANVRQTSEIEFSGNLSSGGGMPVGTSFTKTQRIFDSLGTPHNLIFTFTRLPEVTGSDNQIHYSTEVTVTGGVVKRNDASGVMMDFTGTPMIVTFNQCGQLNLFDYGQQTESNTPPKLYIEWTDTNINSAPLEVGLNLGKGKGASPTVWTGNQEPLAEGNLTAYDGNSMITHSKQDGLGYGRYENVRVSEMGVVSAHYTNGNSIDIGNLAFAIVPNPDGLKQVGSSYRITESSGLPMIALGGQYGWGKLKFTGTNSLEPTQYTYYGSYPSSAVAGVVDELMMQTPQEQVLDLGVVNLNVF